MMPNGINLIIVGPPGSGKTTFLQAIEGLLKHFNVDNVYCSQTATMTRHEEICTLTVDQPIQEYVADAKP